MIDVAALMEAFEEINQVKIILSITLEGTGSLRGLRIGAVAMENNSPSTEATVLASVNASFSAMNLKTVEAAVMHVLYLLDGKIAYQEMAGGAAKKQ